MLILTHNSEDLTMLSLLASLYLQNNQLDSAYTVYDRIIEQEPDNASAYLGRAKVLEQWKSYHDSIEDLEYCLKLQPDLEEALILKDKILQKSYYAMSCYG